jgi:hypothetical protein
MTCFIVGFIGALRGIGATAVALYVWTFKTGGV